jgi:hypothetical protein
MPPSSLTRIALFLVMLSISLQPAPIRAWGYEGYRVVGSIADKLLEGTNAAKQARAILNEGDPNGELDLRLVGPWANCVRAVKLENGAFKYTTRKPGCCCWCTSSATARQGRGASGGHPEGDLAVTGRPATTIGLPPPPIHDSHKAYYGIFISIIISNI